MIETLVVDLAGVAVHYTPERRLTALSDLTGLTEATIQARLFDSGFDAEAERGAYSDAQIVDAVIERLGAEITPHDLIEAWALAFEPDAAVLEYLSSLDLPRVMFTNNGPMFDVCLRGPLASLAPVFGQVICSWHVGARKPDETAFRRVADRLGARPEGLFLLDDSAANVAGAIASGWDAAEVTGVGAVKAAVSSRLESDSKGAHSGGPWAGSP